VTLSIGTADNTDELSRGKLGSKVAEFDMRILYNRGWVERGDGHQKGRKKSGDELVKTAARVELEAV
jgi:hypothetical protein